MLLHDTLKWCISDPMLAKSINSSALNGCILAKVVYGLNMDISLLFVSCCYLFVLLHPLYCVIYGQNTIPKTQFNGIF